MRSLDFKTCFWTLSGVDVAYSYITTPFAVTLALFAFLRVCRSNLLPSQTFIPVLASSSSLLLAIHLLHITYVILTSVRKSSSCHRNVARFLFSDRRLWRAGPAHASGRDCSARPALLTTLHFLSCHYHAAKFLHSVSSCTPDFIHFFVTMKSCVALLFETRQSGRYRQQILDQFAKLTRVSNLAYALANGPRATDTLQQRGTRAVCSVKYCLVLVPCRRSARR